MIESPMAKILHSEAIHHIRQFHPQLNRIQGRGCNLLPFLAVLSGLYYSAFFMQFLLSLTDKSCACRSDFIRLYSFFPANVTGKRQFCTKWVTQAAAPLSLNICEGLSVAPQLRKQTSVLPTVSGRCRLCLFQLTFPSLASQTGYASEWSPFPPHFFFSESLDTKSSRQQISWILFCQNVSRIGFHQHDLLQTV